MDSVIAKSPPHIRLLIKPAEPSFSPYTTYSTLDMERVSWYFPESTVRGIDRIVVPKRTKEMWGYDELGGTVAIGYRCPKCNKVFFAAFLNDFIHECMVSE